MKSILTSLILLLLASASMSAQSQLQPTQAYGSLSCVIVDENGKPVQGVTVRITGTMRGAISRADGSVLIRNIPFGAYRIDINAIGYRRESRDVTISEKLCDLGRIRLETDSYDPPVTWRYNPPARPNPHGPRRVVSREMLDHTPGS